MSFRRANLAVVVILVLGATASVSSADLPPAPAYTPGQTSFFAPQVPVSAFARPSSWLDMSRFHVSTSVSFGSGFGGASSGLQVTSLSYQLAQPLAVRVSVGNTFGSANRGGNSMFLEGFAVQYRPHPSFQINVDYRDIRSPLQYQYSNPFGYYGPLGP